MLRIEIVKNWLADMDSEARRVVLLELLRDVYKGKWVSVKADFSLGGGSYVAPGIVFTNWPMDFPGIARRIVIEVEDNLTI